MSCVANFTADDIVGIVRLRHQIAGIHTDLGKKKHHLCFRFHKQCLLVNFFPLSRMEAKIEAA